MMKVYMYYFLCIPARIAISIAAYLVATSELPFLMLAAALLSFCIGTGFIINWWNHKDIGFFGGNAWWHELRVFHAVLWWNVALLLVAAAWTTDIQLVTRTIAPVITTAINIDWIVGLIYKWLNWNQQS